MQQSFLSFRDTTFVLAHSVSSKPDEAYLGSSALSSTRGIDTANQVHLQHVTGAQRQPLVRSLIIANNFDSVVSRVKLIISSHEQD